MQPAQRLSLFVVSRDPLGPWTFAIRFKSSKILHPLGLFASIHMLLFGERSREASVSLVLALDRDTKRCHTPWPTKLECTLLRPSSGVRSWSSPPSRFLWSLEPAGHLGTSGDTMTGATHATSKSKGCRNISMPSEVKSDRCDSD